jgi:hypothetical protein
MNCRRLIRSPRRRARADWVAREAKRFGCSQVDDKIEFSRKLDWDFGRLRPTENFIHKLMHVIRSACISEVAVAAMTVWTERSQTSRTALVSSSPFERKTDDHENHPLTQGG